MAGQDAHRCAHCAWCVRCAFRAFSDAVLVLQYNDVAILTLDSPVQFRRDIRPICMPSGSAAYAGKTATVIGWGSLRESKDTHKGL